MGLFSRSNPLLKETVPGHWFALTLRFADGRTAKLVADHPARAVDAVNRGEGPAEVVGALPAELVAVEEYMNLEDAKRVCAGEPAAKPRPRARRTKVSDGS
jgi:hypothetical protein